jgi:hypothetical protein
MVRAGDDGGRATQFAAHLATVRGIIAAFLLRTGLGPRWFHRRTLSWTAAELPNSATKNRVHVAQQNSSARTDAAE